MVKKPSDASFPVAILAGGLATRLRPITEKIPKLLVEVAGEPFFSHQLRLLKQNGVTKIVLCVGHLGQQIVDRYGNGTEYGVEISYSFDGEKLLGTGGALRRAIPLLGDAFFVLYGDSYLPVDFAAVSRAFILSGKPALMTVYHNRGQYDTSNVWFEGGRIRLYDKARQLPSMEYIDYGLGVMTRKPISTFPEDYPFDLADVYRTLSISGDLAGFEVAQRFYEIGSPGGLAELNALLQVPR